MSARPPTAPPRRAGYRVPLGALQHRLLLVGLALLGLFALSHPGRAHVPLAAAALFVAVAAHLGLLGGLLVGATFALGLVTRVARFRDAERLLDEVAWRGDEVVLDLGCGDGLMAIAAARRAPGGRVIAIDDWDRPHGGRQGSPARVRENADAEGVAGRLEVRHGPLDRLDLPDDSVDVATACFCLHHLPEARRARALGELARVLRPGGRLLIADVARRAEYAQVLATLALQRVERRSRTFPAALFGWVLADKPGDTAPASAPLTSPATGAAPPRR